MVSRYVAHVFSEWLWNSPSRTLLLLVSPLFLHSTLLLLLLLTAIELSLDGSSPYTSTDKHIRIIIHKRNNTKNTVQTVQNTVNIISLFYQLDAHVLYFHTFITFLYMFRVLLCSSSGGQLYQYSIWYRHSLWVTDQYTGYERKMSAVVNYVLNSHLKRVTITDAVLIQLSSWRWAQWCSKHVEECNKCIKIKNLCIKLVKKKYYIYIRMHGQRNVKTVNTSTHITITPTQIWQE